ncbi:MAG TPA: Gfo/Idh/MocA family oxidoreductase [Burkholderiales bacterium]|jgi:predicted dehydrogenase|nr:Gfo/Idh/MocA family oxidoreductase [Burkholderiales bacterium]
MLNAAIVGLGNWGRKIVETVDGESPPLKISHAVVRAMREDIAAFARKHSITPVTDLRAVLQDPAVDAVIITTPHSLHADQIVASAAAGKHVFCEKPLALRRIDAIRAVLAAERANRVLAVGHDKRYWSSMLALRELATSGTLGRILHIEGHTSNENARHFAAWRNDTQEAPGGGMTGTGVHMLDALIGLAGPLALVKAQLLKSAGDAVARDTLAALLRFKSGISGTLATVRSTPFYWRAHVFGDAGSAEALGPTELVVRTGGGATERRESPAVDSLRAEMNAFAQAVDGGRRTFDGAAMIATVHALEAIIESATTEQSIELA